MATINYPRPVENTPVEDFFLKFANPSQINSPPVTLIRPPIIFSASSYSTPIGLPVGLAYLTAVLKRAHYNVTAIDCVSLGMNCVEVAPDKRFKIRGISVKETIALIDPKTDIIGITIMFSQEWPHVKKFIQKIREVFPKVTFVLGGEHASAVSEFSLRDCRAVDYIVRGEGELALLEICHRLRTKNSPKGIRGVSYLENEKYVENSLAPRISDVGQIPWPAWEAFDLEPYFQPIFTMGISHGRNIAMIATRGCPYQCTFCSNPFMWTTRYGMRPPKDVVDEIAHYMKIYRANSIDFYDLTAIVKKSWILEFAEEIKKRNLKIAWQLPSGTRSEVIDEDVISAISSAGLEFLVYAPESGSTRVLKAIKKQVNIPKMLESIQIAIRYKVVVKVNFIIGFPAEKRSDVFKTLRLVWKLAFMKVDDCNISCFSPYPGSELYAELAREGRIEKMDDRYFENLMIQFDLKGAKTYCREIGSFELAIYRTLGMLLFYGLSYLRCPSRMIRLARMFLRKSQPFQPRSLFEQRMFDLLSRSRTSQAV